MFKCYFCPMVARKLRTLLPHIDSEHKEELRTRVKQRRIGLTAPLTNFHRTSTNLHLPSTNLHLPSTNVQSSSSSSSSPDGSHSSSLAMSSLPSSSMSYQVINTNSSRQNSRYLNIYRFFSPLIFICPIRVAPDIRPDIQ